MSMKRWDPPTWAEMDEDGARKSTMDMFFDALVERLPPGKTRDDWNAIWQRMPVSLGEVGTKAVMILFLYNVETVFQKPIGMVVYPHVGDQLFYIAD